MVQVLKKGEGNNGYWSKADAFLLPLVGLERDTRFEIRSYLFWKNYTIHDYNLIVTFSSEPDTYSDMVHHCRKNIFPFLDRGGYLVENYDIGKRSIFVLDISEWADDVETFLRGKYSKMSQVAIKAIERYHKFNKEYIPIHIYGVIHPNKRMELLDNLTPIEYICQEETYGFNLHDVKRIGEIGTLYDEMEETLLVDVTQICHSDV